jgi:hypothetical protein
MEAKHWHLIYQKYYSALVISCTLLQAWTSKGEQTVVAQLKVFSLTLSPRFSKCSWFTQCVGPAEI